MRASLASSIAVTCAAALALPLTFAPPVGAAADPARGAQGVRAAEVAGSTQSLPLEPLTAAAPPRGRAPDRRAAEPSGDPSGEQGLGRRTVRPFSLVGVVWDDVRTALHGTVQVRTRARTDGVWSPWQDVETHNDEHGADPATAEGHGGALRGATAPLWVGDSDGVEVRVRPEAPPEETAPDASAPRGHGSAVPGRRTPAGLPQDLPEDLSQDLPEELPKGLRLELVDPGTAPGESPDGEGEEEGAAEEAAEAAAASVNAQLAPPGATAIPALTQAQTIAEAGVETGVEAGVESDGGATAAGPVTRVAAAAKPYIGARPKIITRKGWGADERMREKGFVYTKTIKAVFVHHSATGNRYTCRQAPAVLRGIYRYHVKSSGWRDFGYNFAVDKCGNIYEGRAGGVAKPVLGAHTLGFNQNSMGVAVLGTYGGSAPPAAAVTAIARLSAWKLGLHGVNPKAKTYLTSGGGNRYKKGRSVRFHVIAGHRDGFATECPGGRLYGKLGTARSASAKYQGRR
ncbi:N-acetylmuramoyl-L-alanine amidase [Streptomyces sp. NPDC090025]|uniref:N-acetylmuramoyl-L-alanine amidase n=1 Tax=Streptomyces sp. NPDC090025 TaxID=3365922 RepID=UPI0038361FC1